MIFDSTSSLAILIYIYLKRDILGPDLANLEKPWSLVYIGLET
jgi:hypothetical protein